MDERAPLPMSVVEYMRQNFEEGSWPDADPAAALTFLERCFSRLAYKEHRHRILDRLLRAGMSVPRVAVLFDRAERTVWRWKEEMTDWMSEQAILTIGDVRRLFIQRMVDLKAKQDAIDELIFEPLAPAVQKLAAARTSLRYDIMRDHILRQAGFYGRGQLDKMGAEETGRAQETEEFVADLDAALTGEVPLLEHDDGEDEQLVNPGARTAS